MAFPDPTEACQAGGAADDIPGKSKCYGPGGSPDRDPQLQHPGKSLSANSFGNLLRGLNVSDGFNFGHILLPYILDHGDRLGIMTRKKAYVTILHSWARVSDRSYALACVSAFVSRRDRNHVPFLDYLCTAPPFAGYRWDAVPMQRWQNRAVAMASALGARESLDPDAAAAAAVAWCADVVGHWQSLTVERFPYSPPDLVSYWLKNEPPAALPAPGPAPA
jgi:hypothetical protein